MDDLILAYDAARAAMQETGLPTVIVPVTTDQGPALYHSSFNGTSRFRTIVDAAGPAVVAIACCARAYIDAERIHGAHPAHRTGGPA